mmetsp:Transcript_19049/g.21217  ORF Transcript_19049/g.21217 Transcript_19049/m.21217 type:complete len:192 (-) Transcript_19049:90-665(-)
MANPAQVNLAKLGDQSFNKVEKINGELFTLTYGAIVWQLLKDNNNNPEEVNTQLERMGYNIGLRIIDEFLARSNLGRCRTFKDTADVIAKVAFKMFLGVYASITNFVKEKEFTLVIEDNPFTDFVELPDEYKSKLEYCSMLCGIIRGALEMVQMRVACKVVKDSLKGDESTAIRVTLIEIMKDELPVGTDS